MMRIMPPIPDGAYPYLSHTNSEAAEVKFHYTSASAVFREMEMRFRLETAEAERRMF